MLGPGRRGREKENTYQGKPANVRIRGLYTCQGPNARGCLCLDYVIVLFQVQVAVLREEGSNGDREMSAAVHAVRCQLAKYWEVLQILSVLDCFL
jgi:hypothetical protein